MRLVAFPLHFAAWALLKRQVRDNVILEDLVRKINGGMSRVVNTLSVEAAGLRYGRFSPRIPLRYRHLLRLVVIRGLELALEIR